MLAHLQSARLIWPTVLTLVALMLLVSLGNWQWQRLAWKVDLINRLEQGAVAEPISLSAARELIVEQGIEAVRFRRVRATGRFDHRREFHVWAGGASGPAWNVVTPLILSDPLEPDRRRPIDTVLVMRGVVPDERKSPAARASGQGGGDVEFVGRIRLDEGPNWAAGEPDITGNQWFSRDIARMTQELARVRASEADGAALEEFASSVLPFAIEAESAMGGPEAPQPQLDAIVLSNRHFGYALTWWGLAATLVAVYLAFVVSRLRSS